MFVYTNRPTVQGALYLDIDKHCAIDTWLNHGVSSKEGVELDVGASCTFSLTDKTEVEMYAYRDFLYGTSDVTEVSMKITHGAINVSVIQFFWDNNPDATRFEVGYTLKPTEKLSVHPAIVYETGFGEADIIVGTVDIKYAITEKWSIVGSIFTPLYKGARDSRTTQAFVGLSFAF